MENKWGHSSFPPRSGQKGTYLLQVRPLLLGNEECPHLFSIYFGDSIRYPLAFSLSR